MAECVQLSVCKGAYCTFRPEHAFCINTTFLVMQKLDHATEQVETALQKERQLTSHHTQVYCHPPLSDLPNHTTFQNSCKTLHLSFGGPEPHNQDRTISTQGLHCSCPPTTLPSQRAMRRPRPMAQSWRASWPRRRSAARRWAPSARRARLRWRLRSCACAMPWPRRPPPASSGSPSRLRSRCSATCTHLHRRQALH